MIKNSDIEYIDSINIDNKKIRCWGCTKPIHKVTIFCNKCFIIQPPCKMNHFERLNIKPLFNIDLKMLNIRYLESQKLLHPDNFVLKSKDEQKLSMLHSQLLNEAFLILKDSILRAQCILEIFGITSEESHDSNFLIKVMEIQENLENTQIKSNLLLIINDILINIQESEKALTEAFKNKNYNLVQKILFRLRYFTKIHIDARKKLHFSHT